MYHHHSRIIWTIAIWRVHEIGAFQLISNIQRISLCLSPNFSTSNNIEMARISPFLMPTRTQATSPNESAPRHTTIYSPKTYPDEKRCRAIQDSRLWGLRSLICRKLLRKYDSNSPSKFPVPKSRGWKEEYLRGRWNQHDWLSACRMVARNEMRRIGLLLGTLCIGLWGLCFCRVCSCRMSWLLVIVFLLTFLSEFVRRTNRMKKCF